ncbi:MAG: hypothetical protein WC101_00395 [Candidatus Gracilibacteria bacterium]
MLTKDTLPEVAKVPSKVNVQPTTLEQAPTKDLAVFLDAKNPKSVLSHPVLGPVLIPYADSIFTEKDGKVSLVNDPTRLPVNMGSVKTVHLAMGGSMEGSSSDDEYNVPSSWRNAAAKIRGAVGEIQGRKEDGLTIFLGDEMFQGSNPGAAFTALGRGLGNIGSVEGHYKGALNAKKAPAANAETGAEGVGEKSPEATTLGVRKAVGNIYLAGGDPTLLGQLIPFFENGDATSRMQTLVRFLSEAPKTVVDNEAFFKTVLSLYTEAKRADPNLPISMEVWGPATPTGSTVGTLNSELGYTYQPMGKDELQLLQAVQRASTDEKGPYAITISYRGAKNPNSPVNVVVGKTITMDKGGDCAKLGAATDMQGDMTGGAETAGLFARTIEEKPEVNLEFAWAVASNSTDGNGFGVEDIFTHESGVTTRILNTDAEGRLVLADVLAKTLKKLEANGEKAGKISTIATLTGHTMLVSGNEVLAMSSNTTMRRAIEDDAHANGELVQGTRLKPLDKELVKDTAPNGADIKNIAGYPGPGGGTRRGGQTAAAYIGLGAGLNPEQEKNFVHFDIAAMLGNQHFTKDVEKWRFSGAGEAHQTMYNHLTSVLD